MCHITKITSVWRALVDLSKSSVCICSLRISGFAGLTALHLSNPAICICRQVISTLLLEQRWISPKKSFVFSKSNHLHFHSGDIHICQSLLFSSLLINQISPVQTIFTQPKNSGQNIVKNWSKQKSSSRTRWRRRPFLAVLSHLKTLDLPDYDPIISRIKSQKDQNAKSQMSCCHADFFLSSQVTT